MSTESIKVGELAEHTGISVRTLHHYHEIGLLCPSQRTAAGHRLYTPEDVARLQQILSLRELGLSLAQIGEVLSREDYSPQAVIAQHIAQLNEHIAQQQQLRTRLQVIAQRLEGAQNVAIEQFMRVIKEIEMTANFDKYYSPKQQEYLQARARTIGSERIREAERQWQQLIAEVRAEMDKGTDPASPVAAALASRWQALIDEFTGKRADIAESCGKMWRQEPALQQHTGIDSEMFEYIGRAAASKH